MLRRSFKSYLFARDTVAGLPEIEDVDETGIDIIEALDVFSIRPTLPIATNTSTVLGPENDLHSPKVGDIALHDPLAGEGRSQLYSLRDHQVLTSRLEKEFRKICLEHGIVRSKGRNQAGMRCDLEKRIANSSLLDGMKERLDFPPCTTISSPRRKDGFGRRKRTIKNECLLAIERGKERMINTKIPPCSVQWDQARVAFSLDNPQSSFTGYFSKDKQQFEFHGKLCDSNGRFQDAKICLDPSSDSLVIHDVQLLSSEINIAHISSVQIDESGLLIRILSNHTNLALILSSEVSTRTFLSCFEYMKRRKTSVFPPTFSTAPIRLCSKLEAHAFLCEWSRFRDGSRLEPIGEFWYKQGDYLDTRDWSNGYFYIKCGVLYGCIHEGDLPVLVVGLQDISPGVPLHGNRFLLEVGTRPSLTLSSPSLSLISWTSRVLAQASKFALDPDVLGTKLRSLYLTKKELVLMDEPGGEESMRVELHRLVRVLYSPHALTLHLAWLPAQHSRLGIEDPEVGGSILFTERKHLERILSYLSQSIPIQTFLGLANKIPGKTT